MYINISNKNKIMAIRYFNIKEKPDMYGFAIKVNTENTKNKTVEDFSSYQHSFIKIRENDKYTHFKLIEGDYSVLRDRTADATTIDANPVILEKGKGNIASICINDLGNVRIYKNKKKLLINEISKSKAENIKQDAQNWRIMQSWV